MDLKEILRQISDFGVKGMEQTGFPVFVLALLFSLLSSFFVAYLYVVFFQGRSTGTRVHRAFPLLGVSITAIFIAIQFSLPLSLGLLGALSIIRFRTPIKEPEEVAFVMVVVATSLCCATFNLLFLALILATIVVALLVMRFTGRQRGGTPGHGLLVLTLPLAEYREVGEALLGHLSAELQSGELDSVTEGEEEASISYRFVRLGTDRVVPLQASLRGISASAVVNVYFDRAGGV